MSWDDRFLVRKTSGLGIAAFVLGVVALSMAWIPCLGFVTLPISAIGAILGLVAVLIARTRDEGLGFPVAGLLISAVAFGVPFLWIAWANWNTGQMRDRAEQESARVRRELDGIRDGDAIQISANELAEAYQDDKRAADAKYKNRILEVEGEISFVEGVVVGGSCWLQLKAGDVVVTCYFPPDQQHVLVTLKVGERVTVHGRGDGELRGPRLKQCLLKQ